MREADGPRVITWDLVLVLEDSFVIGEETEPIVSDFVLTLVNELGCIYFGESVDMFAVHLLMIITICYVSV